MTFFIVTWQGLNTVTSSIKAIFQNYLLILLEQLIFYMQKSTFRRIGLCGFENSQLN